MLWPAVFLAWKVVIYSEFAENRTKTSPLVPFCVCSGIAPLLLSTNSYFRRCRLCVDAQASKQTNGYDD